MEKIILLLITVLLLKLPLYTYAQTSTIPETREIILNSADTIQKIRIFIENPDVRINAHKVYAWYQKQTVLHTQGSWSGKLLQGKSESFYPNHNLLEQGSYERGWKKGEWKKWYSNGVLKEKNNWKSGELNGSFEHYNPDGSIVQKGTYLKGKLHGNLSNFADGKELKEKYRKGELVVKKVKVEKPDVVKKDSTTVSNPKKESAAKTPKENEKQTVTKDSKTKKEDSKSVTDPKKEPTTKTEKGKEKQTTTKDSTTSKEKKNPTVEPEKEKKATDKKKEKDK